MPSISESQRRAMWAAREGHSTLGIPKEVGEEFTEADKKKKKKKKLPEHVEGKQGKKRLDRPSRRHRESGGRTVGDDKTYSDMMSQDRGTRDRQTPDERQSIPAYIKDIKPSEVNPDLTSSNPALKATEKNRAKGGRTCRDVGGPLDPATQPPPTTGMPQGMPPGAPPGAMPQRPPMAPPPGSQPMPPPGMAQQQPNMLTQSRGGRTGPRKK